MHAVSAYAKKWNVGSHTESAHGQIMVGLAHHSHPAWRHVWSRSHWHHRPPTKPPHPMRNTPWQRMLHVVLLNTPLSTEPVLSSHQACAVGCCLWAPLQFCGNESVVRAYLHFWGAHHLQACWSYSYHLAHKRFAPWLTTTDHQPAWQSSGRTQCPASNDLSASSDGSKTYIIYFIIFFSWGGCVWGGGSFPQIST